MSRSVTVLLAAVLATVPLARCGDADPFDAGPYDAGAPRATSTSGEVWHWALGRELFVDPLVTSYSAGTDARAGAQVDVAQHGFTLVADRYGRVASVVLHAAGPDLSAYAGALPQALAAPTTWRSTAAHLGVADDPGLLCHDGACRYDVVDHEGHLLTLTFTEPAADDPAVAWLCSVEVSWRGGSSLYHPQVVRR